MKLPKAWSNILVDQYIELRELETTPSLSFIDKDLEILSIVTDTDIEEFEELELHEVTTLLSQLLWIKKEPPRNIVKEIDKYHYIGLEDLTLAEYIDLNHFFSTNFVTNLPTICGLLFRQKSVNDWGLEVVEPYEYDPQTREHLFLELPITSVYGVIGEFLDFKKNFEETYKNLFDKDMSDEPTEGLTKEEIDDIKEEERLNKWSWERMVYTLCDGNISDMNKVLDLKLTFVFNMLSMKKDLSL